MYGASLHINTKFDTKEILKYWFGMAFGSTLFFPSVYLNKRLYKLIYDKLIDVGGDMPRIKDDSPLAKKTKSNGGGKTIDPDTVLRREYVCELLMEREHTDKEMLRKVNKKFTKLKSVILSHIGKIRSRINRGVIKECAAPKKRLLKILEE